MLGIFLPKSGPGVDEFCWCGTLIAPPLVFSLKIYELIWQVISSLSIQHMGEIEAWDNCNRPPL